MKQPERAERERERMNGKINKKYILHCIVIYKNIYIDVDIFGMVLHYNNNNEKKKHT